MRTQELSNPHERGSSLLEVLIAMAILMMLMVGILSLFSMAFVSNMGAMARTEMTYKAEQVAEGIRYLNFVYKTNPTSLPSSTITGITLPLAATSTPINLTTVSGSALTYSYWGYPTSAAPNNIGIIDPQDLPYQVLVSVSAADATTGLASITVTVSPAATTIGRKYMGAKMAWKEVNYVAQLLP